MVHIELFDPDPIPCAIHLGWNFTQNFIFSQGPIGNGIFVQVKPVPILSVSYFIYFIILFFPIISMLLINYILLKRRKQIEIEPNTAR